MSKATGEIHYFPDDEESEYNMLTRMSIALQTYSLIVTLQSMSSHASSVVSNGAIVDFHYGSLLPSFVKRIKTADGGVNSRYTSNNTALPGDGLKTFGKKDGIGRSFQPSENFIGYLRE